MVRYWCRTCADDLDAKASARTADPLQSAYQLEKWGKHSAISAGIGYQTVFDSTSSSYYAGVISEAVDRGFLEQDDRGRLNILYRPSTGSAIGREFAQGRDLGPRDMVRVVRWSVSTGIHAMLDASSDFSTARCVRCGRFVLNSWST